MTLIRPRDLQPGMRAKFYVHHTKWDTDYDQFCLVLDGSKVRRDGATKYVIRIEETVAGVPTGKKSTRTLSPQDWVEIQEDRLGNRIRREGCDRCWCGCKYWEHDVCVDCGGTEPQPD